MKEQPAHRRGGVDRLGVADEVDAEIPEFLKRGDERPEGAGEAVVFPDQHAIEAPPACVGHHGLELRRPLAAPRVAGDRLDVLAINDEAATLGVVPQLAQLQLRVLLARRHTGVDRHPHRPLATMMAPTAFGRAQYCRFVHTETAPAKPMRNKGSDETNSEGFSAHPELSRRSAAHARRHPASWGRLCEVLDRILAVVQDQQGHKLATHQKFLRPGRLMWSEASAFDLAEPWGWVG